MKEFEGVNIREVWDFRLSTAIPQIDRSSGSWVVNIYSKSNPDYVVGGEESKPLASYDTGIAATPNDIWDKTKISRCYEWLYSVRDQYALPDIEERKPHVKKINDANKALSELGKA